MYIRRTTIKSRQTGEPYYTYRLVESIREGKQVRQRTLQNLGRHFEVPRAQWGALVQRIEHLVGGQQDLMPAYLDAQWEEAAQRYAAQLIRARANVEEGGSGEGADYHSVDVDRLLLVLQPSAYHPGQPAPSISSLHQAVGLNSVPFGSEPEVSPRIEPRELSQRRAHRDYSRPIDQPPRLKR